MRLFFTLSLLSPRPLPFISQFYLINDKTAKLGMVKYLHLVPRKKPMTRPTPHNIAISSLNEEDLSNHHDIDLLVQWQ